MTTYERIERQRVLDIAQEYRDKGYEVTVEPDPQSLPDSLKKYHPDLVIRNGEERIIVEVKTFASLVSPNQLTDLAQAVRKEPGWRLELAVVNPKRAGQTGSASTESAIQDRLADASQLRSEGYSNAALLATLSALEAALRLADMSSGSGRVERSAPTVARSLFKQGLLTPAEHAAVARGLRLRNSTVPNPTDQAVDDRLTDELLPIIQSLSGRSLISEGQPMLAAA